MKRIDPVEDFMWSNKVRAELSPPNGWENWSKHKQIRYLNVPSFVIEMEKIGNSWSFGGNAYRGPEAAVASYLVHDRNWIEVDSTAVFNFCTFAMLDQVPSKMEFDVIEGRKYYRHLTETYREECLQVAQSITIEQIISHSEEIKKKLPPAFYPPTLSNGPLLQRAYNALGINKIRKILERATVGGMSTAGVPDLTFIVREGEHERIVFVEVKTTNDRLLKTQFYFIRNFRDGAALDYQIGHLHRPKPILER